MAKRQLTPEQELAIQWLAQVKRGGKTKREIAEMCGVSDRTLRNWQKMPEFQKELKDEMVRVGQDMLPEVITNIYEVARSSENAAMAKLVLQLNGLLTQQVEIGKKVIPENGIDYDAIDDEIASFAKNFDEEVH